MAEHETSAELEGTAEDHDVFVSYASSDDVAPDDAERGWVSSFVSDLKRILRRKIGGAGAKVWMGLVESNRPATERLLQLVSGSRVMLVVLSPGYCRSDWCRLELATFVSEAERRGHRYAVIPVLIEEVDRNEWPLPVQPLTPTSFLQAMPNSGARRLAGDGRRDRNNDLFYSDRVVEVADQIQARLKAAPIAPSIPRHAVVLAEPADDVDHLHAEMARALRQRGDVVLLPAHDYVRENVDDYASGVRHALSRARLHVQLLGTSPGASLVGGERIVALQARLAAEQAQRSGMQSMRWWLPPTPDFKAEHVADAALRALLEDPATSRLPFEQFRMAVLRAIDELAAAGAGPSAPVLRLAAAALAAPAPPALAAPTTPPPMAAVPPGAAAAPDALAPQASDDEPLIVYLHAAPEDASNAEHVCEHLQNDADVIVLRSPAPRPDVPYLEALRAQEQSLSLCHGELVLYGQSKEPSVSYALLYALRVPSPRGRRVKAVLDLPPHDKPPLSVSARGLLRIDCRDGFEPTRLDAFYRAMREGRRGA